MRSFSKLFELDHIEIAVVVGALARSQKELELYKDQCLEQYKLEIDNLIHKFEGTPHKDCDLKKVDS